VELFTQGVRASKRRRKSSSHKTLTSKKGGEVPDRCTSRKKRRSGKEKVRQLTVRDQGKENKSQAATYWGGNTTKRAKVGGAGEKK